MPSSAAPSNIILQWTQAKITSIRFQITFPQSRLVAPMLFSTFRFLYSSLLNHSNSLSPLGLRFYSHFRSIPNDFDVRNVVSSFHRMLQMGHTPSIVEFNKILTSLVKSKTHYSTVLSLSRQMEFKGIKPDLFTLSILINCYCHLGQMNFSFSIFAKILKMGYHPHIITLNTLIKGLCLNGKVKEALHFHDHVLAL
jgi:pentatricopeptide repeat protein